MTPEAILHKHVDKESMDELSENVWPDIVDAMREYALHIAREAVEDEINEQILQNGLRPEIIRNAVHEVLTSLPLNILSRIESKLKEES